MPFTGLSYPCDVLAKHVKLKLPVDQWILLPSADRHPLAAALIP